jgi:hypothetical protein
MILLERNLDTESDVTNNVCYVWVSLLPCLAFYKKPLFRYVGIALITMMVLICAKRGAIVAAILIDIYFIFASLKGARATNKIGIVLLVTAITFILASNFNLLIGDGDYLSSRLETL